METSSQLCLGPIGWTGLSEEVTEVYRKLFESGFFGIALTVPYHRRILCPLVNESHASMKITKVGLDFPDLAVCDI